MLNGVVIQSQPVVHIVKTAKNPRLGLSFRKVNHRVVARLRGAVLYNCPGDDMQRTPRLGELPIKRVVLSCGCVRRTGLMPAPAKELPQLMDLQ